LGHRDATTRVAALHLGTVAAFELGLAEPFLELDFIACHA